MKRPTEYKFRIDAYSPETIPMAKLAEYMADLSALLGCYDRVHFSHLEDGSTVLVQKIDPEGVPAVEERVTQLGRRAGPPEATKAFAAINERLERDNAIGLLTAEGDGLSATVLRFPGRERPRPLVYGGFNQEGSLEGEIIRVGGKDETVPIWLQDGEKQYNCTATVDMSRQLAPYYRAGTIRVYGTGRWHREEDGRWELERFTIRHFEPLDDAPLAEVIERMRAVPGNRWKGFDDPLGELSKLRSGDGDGGKH